MIFALVKPAKARPYDKKRDSFLLAKVTPKNVVAEIKRNGWRYTVTSEGSLSATGHKANLTFIQPSIPGGWAIDGEIAFDDFSKRPSDVGHALAERDHKGLYFFAFDVLKMPMMTQVETMKLPFSTRRKCLEQLFEDECYKYEKFKLNEIFYDDFPELIKMLKDMGAEGAIFKYLDRSYQPGGRANMIKYKFFEDYDVVIVDALGKPTEWTVRPGDTGKDGVLYPKGKHAAGFLKGYVNIRYGLYDHKTMKLVLLGSLGETGPKEKMEKLIGKVAVVKAYDIFPTGCLQHPIFQGWRDPKDKSAEMCLFNFEEGVAV